MLVEPWNFRNAKRSHCIALTNNFAKILLRPDSPDVDQAYHDFCNIISSAPKRFIPLGRRNNHIPCWDSECDNLYRMFLRIDGNNYSRAATALFTRLDRKGRNRWYKAAQAIDFSHSSRKAWSILITLLAGQDTALITAPSQLTPLHLS